MPNTKNKPQTEIAREIEISATVQVIQDQSRVRGNIAKCPGRIGVVVRRNNIAGVDHGGLWYVHLQATKRAQSKEECFWGDELHLI